jgi:cell shape-determining protein MreC
MRLNPFGDKKGMELVWWTLMVLVILIVVFLIFYSFIRQGFFQIGSLTNPIFNSPGNFVNTTP